MFNIKKLKNSVCAKGLLWQGKGMWFGGYESSAAINYVCASNRHVQTFCVGFAQCFMYTRLFLLNVKHDGIFLFFLAENSEFRINYLVEKNDSRVFKRHIHCNHQRCDRGLCFFRNENVNCSMGVTIRSGTRPVIVDARLYVAIMK